MVVLVGVVLVVVLELDDIMDLDLDDSFGCGSSYQIDPWFDHSHAVVVISRVVKYVCSATEVR